MTRADNEQTVWTEDELALMFWDYSACSQNRCDWKSDSPCGCRHDARRIVHMIKHVLPNSVKIAPLTRPNSNDPENKEGSENGGPSDS